MNGPYGTVVLEHFRRPRNQRPLDNPTVAQEAFNPLCGDRVRLELRIAAEVVAEAAFTASACAICTASASLLTERLTGLPLAAARAIADREIVDSLGGTIPAARHACATLSLEALRQALSALPAAAT